MTNNNQTQNFNAASATVDKARKEFMAFYASLGDAEKAALREKVASFVKDLDVELPRPASPAPKQP